MESFENDEFEVALDNILRRNADFTDVFERTRLDADDNADETTPLVDLRPGQGQPRSTRSRVHRYLTQTVRDDAEANDDEQEEEEEEEWDADDGTAAGGGEGSRPREATPMPGTKIPATSSTLPPAEVDGFTFFCLLLRRELASKGERVEDNRFYAIGMEIWRNMAAHERQIFKDAAAKNKMLREQPTTPATKCEPTKLEQIPCKLKAKAAKAKHERVKNAKDKIAKAKLAKAKPVRAKQAARRTSKRAAKPKSKGRAKKMPAKVRKRAAELDVQDIQDEAMDQDMSDGTVSVSDDSSSEDSD